MGRHWDSNGGPFGVKSDSNWVTSGFNSDSSGVSNLRPMLFQADPCGIPLNSMFMHMGPNGLQVGFQLDARRIPKGFQRGAKCGSNGLPMGFHKGVEVDYCWILVGWHMDASGNATGIQIGC